MSERIKILAAAARERTFTVPQLARAASANIATVRTVLKRTGPDWFVNEKTKNRRGAPTISYTLTSVGKDAIEDILRSASINLVQKLPGSSAISEDEDAELSIGAANEFIFRAETLLAEGKSVHAVSLLDQAEAALESAFPLNPASLHLVSFVSSQRQLLALERQLRPQSSKPGSATDTGSPVGIEDRFEHLLDELLPQVVQQTTQFLSSSATSVEKARRASNLWAAVERDSGIAHFSERHARLERMRRLMSLMTKDKNHDARIEEWLDDLIAPQEFIPSPVGKKTHYSLGSSTGGSLPLLPGPSYIDPATFSERAESSEWRRYYSAVKSWDPISAHDEKPGRLNAVTGGQLYSLHLKSIEHERTVLRRSFNVVIVTQSNPNAREVAGYACASLKATVPDVTDITTFNLDHIAIASLEETLTPETYLLFAIDSTVTTHGPVGTGAITRLVSKFFNQSCTAVLDAASSFEGEMTARAMHARYISHTTRMKPVDLLKQIDDTVASK